MNYHQQPNNDNEGSGRPICDGRSLAIGAGLSCLCVLIAAAGFWFGSHRQSPPVQLLPLAAAAADSSDSMAMATGLVADDIEGVFFIDFITGDLQCLVFYPRSGAFGAHFYTNVKAQLGTTGKNSKYLIATGFAAPRGASVGPRPGSSLIYVTDVNTGMFAAYAVPWDRTTEATGRVQGGPLVFVGGGPIRNYQLPNPLNAQPPAVVDPNANRNP